jgi:hypothetical protein
VLVVAVAPIKAGHLEVILVATLMVAAAEEEIM